MAVDRRAGGADRRILVPQRHNGNRPFVHAVSANQLRDSCIRKRVYRCAGMPAEPAAASSCDSAVPASQYTCR